MVRSSYSSNRPRSVTVLLAATVGLGVTTAVPAEAASGVIVLPGATSAEGIARGEGDTFYAGDLFAGDIFRGDLEEQTAELFIDAPDGRAAVGMFADLRHDLLFVAGGFTGQAYVYDVDSGETVATYQFAPPSAADADPPTTLINDVTVTEDGAWFTDSRRGVLFFVPIDDDGEPGDFSTLELEGPAADTSGVFNLNGIATTRHGSTLIIAHAALGKLYTVDPETGESAEIADVSVPTVDGIVVRGRHVWAVQNSNQVTELELNEDRTAGSVVEVIKDAAFGTPTTAIRFDGHLAVVNAHFETGLPPTADQYEVVLVDD
jgi:sugar lactone lactonase YvrE